MDLEGVAAIVATLIAAGSLVVAAIARRDSERSARASDAAAESARRSAVAAEETLDHSRLETRRRLERTDVEWLRVEMDGGHIRYRNVGTTTAHAVSVALHINKARVEFDRGDVEPNGFIDYDATDAHQAALDEWASTQRSMSAAGYGYYGTPRFDVSARIIWESELGTPAIATLAA